MKNLLFTVLLYTISAGCDNDENTISQNSIFGSWIFDTLTYEENIWLRELNAPEWRSLVLNLNPDQNNEVIQITSINSPDHNIFPPSALWTLESTSENNSKYIGEIEGFAIEGVSFRNYFITVNRDELIISTLIEPDCPEGVDCTLEICCDTNFKFIRSSETN